MSPRSTPSRRRAGFTLVEMMVALTAGAFAVAGAYYLTGTSSRLFNDQMSTSELTSSLRMAMEQIKRDVGRAGFLSARSRRELYSCSGQADQTETSPAEVDGFAIFPNTYTGPAAALLNVTQNRLRADRLVLNGNYASSDAYLIDPSFDPTSGVIALQAGHESFQRAFTESTARHEAPTFRRDRFDAMFRTDRMLRIEHMQSGRVFFRRITMTTSNDDPFLNPPTIRYDAARDPLPALCFTESEVAVSPVVRVSYQVEAPADAPLDIGLGYTGNGRVNGERAVLVRRELSASDDAHTTTAQMPPTPGTARVVLDFVAEFQVNAWIDTNTPFDGTPPAANSSPVLAYVDDAPTLNSISLQRAHQFRSAVISLAARAPEADNTVNCVERPASLRSPLMTFRVAATGEGTYERCARVRSLKTEIYMPNMAFRTGGT